MSLQRTYQRKCDGCGVVHRTLCDTARRSLAAMRRDGWVRRQMVVGGYDRPEYLYSPRTHTYEPSGKVDHYTTTAGRDFCPECAGKEENQ